MKTNAQNRRGKPAAGLAGASGVSSVATLAGSGGIVADIAARGAMSRSAIVEASGLARATIVGRLDRLFSANLLLEVDGVASGRGRPAALIDINKQSALIYAADVGEDFIRLAITDLEPTILTERVVEYDRGLAGFDTLEQIAASFEDMRSGIKLPAVPVLGACISVPAPVDFEAGIVRGPSVIPALEEIPARDWLSARLAMPTYVENDVNLLTLAEKQNSGRESDHFLYVKLGTGIGSGIMSQRVLYRGHKGVAGDIGHIQFARPPLHQCRCGKMGCVESRASGWAIVRDLKAAGVQAETKSDVLDLVRADDPVAIELVRKASSFLGDTIADAISILNPDTIAIGGSLAALGDVLLQGIREAVRTRVLPIAAQELKIVEAEHTPQTGLIGAARLVLDMELSPTRAEASVQRIAVK